MPELFLPIIQRAMLPLSNRLGIGAGGGIYANHVTRSGARRTWSLRAPLYAGVECIPCVWGVSDVRQIQNGQPICGNSDWIIGFNETDRRDQSNIAPADAAQLWHVLESHPTICGKKLTSPSQFYDPDFVWLREFRNQYHVEYGQYPRLDAIDIHCYSDNTKIDRQTVRNAVALAHDWGIHEVWITEFQYGHWIQDGAQWKARDFITWLIEDQPMVRRAFWFCGYVRPGEQWYPQDWYYPNLVLPDPSGNMQMTAMGGTYRDMCMMDISQ